MQRETKGLEEARAVKAKAYREFEKVASVCGVGITRSHGVYAVKVNLEAEPECPEDLPTEIDGVPIVVKVVGKVRKQARASDA